MTDFLVAADRIARQICRDALWSKDRCTWMVWSFETLDHGPMHPYRTTAPGAFYHGVAGIAHFLGYATHLTQNPHLKRACYGALRQMAAQCAEEQHEAGSFQIGTLGAAHTMARLGDLFNDAGLLSQGLDLAKKAGALINSADDVMGGAAGAIPALIDLGCRFAEPDFIDLATLQADHLLARMIVDEAGCSWASPGHHGRNLCGYSHGVSGYVTAFAELNAVRPDPRYRAAIEGGLAYEQHFFNPDVGHWPDFRVMPGTVSAAPPYPVAWCHGAAGIGLSRARLYALMPDHPTLMMGVDAAQRAVTQMIAAQIAQPITDFSPCHGLSGLADFCLMIGTQFENTTLIQNATAVGRIGIDHFQNRGMPWPCGVPSAGETPGMLVGSAGIGQFYLRLHDHTIPSALMITPPDRLKSTAPS